MAVVSDRSAACVCCLPIVLSVRVLGTAWLCALHMAVRDPLRPPSGGHCPSGMQHDVGAHGDGSSSGAAGEGLQFASRMPRTVRCARHLSMIQIATLHGLCVHRAAIYSRIVRDVIFVYSVDGDMGKRQLYATMPACLYDVTGTCRRRGVFSIV